MGCKSIQFEGSLMTENLIKLGFTQVSSVAEADYFILNSCSVTHKSDNEALYLLRNAVNLYPDIKTVITGCVAQIEKEKQTLARARACLTIEYLKK
jgi:threonylcarbamoyladenosine tRNA methylthiotransferase MtaB